MTWRPDSNSVSGPNMGWIEVTLQPCDFRASSPERSGDFSDPTSKITPGGPPQRQIAQDRIRDAQRRGQHDVVVLEVGRAPVLDVRRAGRRARRVRHLDRKALRGEELDEPAAHLAGAADHQGAPAGARAAGSDARVFLRGEGGADQQAQQILRERLGDTPSSCGLGARRPGSLPARARSRASGVPVARFTRATSPLMALRSATSDNQLTVDLD